MQLNIRYPWVTSSSPNFPVIKDSQPYDLDLRNLNISDDSNA